MRLVKTIRFNSYLSLISFLALFNRVPLGASWLSHPTGGCNYKIGIGCPGQKYRYTLLRIPRFYATVCGLNLVPAPTLRAALKLIPRKSRLSVIEKRVSRKIEVRSNRLLIAENSHACISVFLSRSKIQVYIF